MIMIFLPALKILLLPSKVSSIKVNQATVNFTGTIQVVPKISPFFNRVRQHEKGYFSAARNRIDV